MIGRTLGSYAIQRELGRGGMGAVYLGHHALLGRQAAIKVLLPGLSQDQQQVRRFFNEARAATAIKHPGIVEIYDFGFAEAGDAGEGAAYIVMELCQGETLAARIRRVRPVPLTSALGIARQVAGALAAAHEAGIVHRDLKPDNVFLVPDPEVAGGERIKLLDFGIAKLAPEHAGPGLAKTSTGQIIGTPLYMSPEQCRGAGAVDHRADLYALGCILFEMLCGRVPFLGEGAGDVISGHILLAPPPPRSLAPGMPADVEALILHLLAKKAADRPPDADAVVAELHRLAGSSPGVIVEIPARDADLEAHAPTLLPGGTTTAPAVASTTLGASSAQAIAPARPGRRARWIGAAIAGAAAAVVATVVVVSQRGGGGADAARAPVETSLLAARAAIARHDSAAAKAALDQAASDGADDAVLAPLRAELGQLGAPATPVAKPPTPGAITIVLGPMGGATIQNAAIESFAKYAPDMLVLRADDPATAGLDPARSFFLDAGNLDVTTAGAAVTCKVSLSLATFPSRDAFAFLNGGGSVAAQPSGSDLDTARSDCASAVVDDLVKTKIVKRVQDRIGAAGGTQAADIKAVIHDQLPGFTACYQARLADLPTLAGEVEVTFVIGTDGGVLNAHATGLDPQVASCIEDLMPSLRFAAPAGGGTVMTTYTFRFAPDTAPAINR